MDSKLINKIYKEKCQANINFLVKLKENLAVTAGNFTMLNNSEINVHGEDCLIIQQLVKQSRLIYICNAEFHPDTNRYMTFLGVYKDDKFYAARNMGCNWYLPDDCQQTLASHNLYFLDKELQKVEAHIKELYADKMAALKAEHVVKREYSLANYEKRGWKQKALADGIPSFADIVWKDNKVDNESLLKCFCDITCADDYANWFIEQNVEDWANLVFTKYDSVKAFFEKECIIQPWEKELYKAVEPLDKNTTVSVTFSHKNTQVETKLKINAIIAHLFGTILSLGYWINNSSFELWEFENCDEGERALDMFEELDPTCADISKISYNEKVLYEREIQ
jgi:hypothetical protein